MTTRPARRASASRSRRPRPSATCGWQPSRGCTSDEWSGRSVTTMPRTTRSCPRARGTARPTAGNRPCSVSASSPRWTATSTACSRSSTSPPSPTSRCSRSTRSAVSRKPTSRWRSRHTSSPNETGWTDEPVQRRARPLARARRPAERDRARPRRRVPDHDGRADARVRALRRHDPDRVRRARPLDVDLRRDRHADLRGVDVAHRRLELAPDDGAPHPHVRHRRAARRLPPEARVGRAARRARAHRADVRQRPASDPHDGTPRRRHVHRQRHEDLDHERRPWQLPRPAREDRPRRVAPQPRHVGAARAQGGRRLHRAAQAREARLPRRRHRGAAVRRRRGRRRPAPRRRRGTRHRAGARAASSSAASTSPPAVSASRTQHCRPPCATRTCARRWDGRSGSIRRSS